MKKNTLLVSVSSLLFGLAFVIYSVAAPLTAPRDTPKKLGDSVSLNVASNVSIFRGALVCSSNGLAKPAVDITNHVVIGRAERTIEDSLGTEVVRIRRGVFRYDSGTSTISNFHIGRIVYTVDDATVGLPGDSTTRNEVGRIIDVDSDGVWVDINERSRTE